MEVDLCGDYFGVTLDGVETVGDLIALTRDTNTGNPRWTISVYMNKDNCLALYTGTGKSLDDAILDLMNDKGVA